MKLILSANSIFILAFDLFFDNVHITNVLTRFYTYGYNFKRAKL